MILATLNSELVSPSDGLLGLGGEIVEGLGLVHIQTNNTIFGAMSQKQKSPPD